MGVEEKWPPVVCSSCSALALAMLDGNALCQECLVRKVQASKSLDVVHDIVPLPPTEIEPGQEVAATAYD